MAETYTCDQCHGTFDEGWSDEEANAEALENFGVANASRNTDMARICDDCYKAMTSWLNDQPDFSG